MLQELSIQNLALIEKLTLEFKTGFTTLTGETGAGKSILLDALGLCLGERADSGLVRYGTDRADVTADFAIQKVPHALEWLKQQELDDEDNCLLRRTVTSEGRSKAYINGLPVAIGQLKELSALLIDIHGQHEHQTLLHANQQLALLDAYAQHPDLVEKCRKNYQAWSKLTQHYQKLTAEQSDKTSKIELLEFQLKEFNKVSPQAEEFELLSEEQNALSHAQEIQQASLNAYELIDGEDGVSERLARAIDELESAVEFQPQLKNTLTQLNSLLIEAQEAAADCQHQGNSIELDPERLQQVEERLAELFGLAKKYHLSPEELVGKHQQLRQELDLLTDSSNSLEHLETEIKNAFQTFEQSAKTLSASRQKSAKILAKTVTASMHELGMPNGQFEIAITPLEKPLATGSDRVELLVTANKGQPLQPLAKVASGGELSRISLAIQVASAEVASLPTLIFDEVDVGIGGGIAEVVGQKMQTLGSHRQVLSITHLAQVAAHGNQHYHISKTTENDLTFTQVNELNTADRIEELARMLGGLKITEQTRSHAQEMLETAQSISTSPN
ncbi:DNA repair protein RecN [Thiosulfativibrio zosterae]|uniref:DNA repair protein RecN n=2 Tax=Thiosulfativibrio zosterae TaxID=2675053 RepID=A0A6F8PP25_9GAMM|nr:DNA repair protein RecN [Thiosulfativibrio zosterae]